MSSVMATVRVGFVPLMDAALLVVAREEGFAAAEGIDLALVKEGSWAAVRDKLNARLFDAAHMLAPAAIASTLGLGHFRAPLASPVALSLDGNAITVSNALAAELVGLDGPDETAKAMAALIARRARAGAEPFTIGVVFGYSCHLYQVRAWLKLGGVDPERDVRLVVIPPPLMAESLAAGHLDLFCAGAPWNRQAEEAGAGKVLHPCHVIAPDCLEKLLVVRADQTGAPWLPGLVRAVVRAAEWAGETRNIAKLARLLASPDYVGASAGLIEAILTGEAHALADPATRPWLRIDGDATLADASRLARVYDMMRDAGQIVESEAARRATLAIMRPDLRQAALAG